MLAAGLLVLGDVGLEALDALQHVALVRRKALLLPARSNAHSLADGAQLPYVLLALCGALLVAIGLAHPRRLVAAIAAVCSIEVALRVSAKPALG